MSLLYERRMVGLVGARALHDSEAAHVADNAALLGDLTRGPHVACNISPAGACELMRDYYYANRTSNGLRVGPLFKPGFGNYVLTHDPYNSEKQKERTSGQVCDGPFGSKRKFWAKHVAGFDEVEADAARCAMAAYPELGALDTAAWHILEQPPHAGDSTSFGVHHDALDPETKNALVTVVVKLTHGPSRMYVEGARGTFGYAHVPCSATFRANAWHRSIPIREGDPTALKIAFFYRRTVS